MSVNMKISSLLLVILVIPNLLASESDEDVGSYRTGGSDSSSEIDSDNQQTSELGKYIQFLTGLSFLRPLFKIWLDIWYD